MVAKDETITKPEKFKYSEWNQWEESVYLYLNSWTSKCGAPLSYVIRKDLDEDVEWESLEREVQQIHAAPLEGFMFQMDSKRVLAILKDLCLNTSAESWFRNIQCRRRVMQALQRHYDGPDERHKRIEEARVKISQTFYKHEARCFRDPREIRRTGLWKGKVKAPIYQKFEQPPRLQARDKYLPTTLQYVRGGYNIFENGGIKAVLRVTKIQDRGGI